MNPNPAGIKSISGVPRPSPSQSSVSVNIDDDVSDLLRDNFGPAKSEDFTPKIDFSDIELDKNLSEILEDLQKVVKAEDGENNNSSSYDCSSLINDPIQSLLNIQNEMEMEIEEERVERMRNPKFQTLPAYQKRAKQETQWMKAVNAAKVAKNPESPLSLDRERENEKGYKPLAFSSQIVTQAASTTTTHGGKRVEVISIAEDEADDFNVSSLVSPKVKGTGTTDLVAELSLSKSNILMNTERHLSSSNHFPANSRIFNRSLEELQSTAEAISKSYLQEEKGNKISSNLAENKMKKPKKFSPYSSKSGSSGGNKRQLDKMRSILIKNNNSVKTGITPNREKEKVDIYNSVWLPALKQRIEAGKLRGPSLPFKLPTRKPCHVSLPQSPVQFSSPQHVKLPINGLQTGATLLLNMSTSPPVLLNKSQILQAATVSRPPAAQFQQCLQCQRLSSCLPYLGYNMRKQLLGEGLLSRSRNNPLVLLCEVCGAFVRESVIYSEQIGLGQSVFSGQFPRFFNNTNIATSSVNEESQNYISI